MQDFSDKSIRKKCPHCDLKSFAYKAFLEKTENFSIICDTHPLVEGHILIIPKQHISCIGEFESELYVEFKELFNKVIKFLKIEYGKVGTFEHGKIGQTVYHSHVHLLPFQGKPIEIIPEGKKYIRVLKDLSQLKDIFQKNEKYLFFSIENKMWTVDPFLGKPRFFRDRFAQTLGSPERGNWKNMHEDEQLMSIAEDEIKNLQTRWIRYNVNTS